MTVLDLLKSVGQCKDFRDKVVSKSVMYDVVEALVWSSFPREVMNVECVVVRDEKMLVSLADQCPKQSWLAKVPSMVAIVNDGKVVEKLYDDRGKLYATQSVGAAVQSLLLRLQDVGLAGFWVRSFNDKAVARLLKIPDGKVVEALVVVGYPKKKVVHDGPVVAVDKMLSFEEYGNKESKE
ncbi:MAG: nitroreductase family protein [Nanoarchaeota archaeon]|nr:nitroreductase family protein [Nanoarchaeota archaeon]